MNWPLETNLLSLMLLAIGSFGFGYCFRAILWPVCDFPFRCKGKVNEEKSEPIQLATIQQSSCEHVVENNL